MNDILEGYAVAATPSLIARYDELDSRRIYAPVLDLLPAHPVRVADIGTGTGRDADWFARQGHDVLAIEPVRELREPGMMLHPSAKIEWLDDRLPHLEKAQTYARFGLVTLCGVWQHIDDEARRVAMKSIARMVADDGLLVMSLRHGPGAPGRRIFPISPKDTVEAAELSGFRLIRQAEVDSIQTVNRENGVRWTWLALRKIGDPGNA